MPKREPAKTDSVLVLYRGHADGNGSIRHEGPIILPALDRPAMVLESGLTVVDAETVTAYLDMPAVKAMQTRREIEIFDEPGAVLRNAAVDLFGLISVTRDPFALQALLDAESASSKPREQVMAAISDRLSLYAKHRPIKFNIQDVPDLGPAKVG